MKLMLAFVLFTACNVALADEVAQPSVSRRVLLCDQWQWIGNDAVTWGCLTTPRQGFVAGGQVTDEVIVSLQDQIAKLKAQVDKLEKHRH